MVVDNLVNVVLKACSLGLVIAAGGLWASAGVNSRPKDKDEQTLIGGALWSQTLIPIGLIISTVVNDQLFDFVHAYFLLAGFGILATTGALLIIEEGRKQMNHRQTSIASLSRLPSNSRTSFDKVYFLIGVCCFLASIVTLANFVIVIAF